MEQRLIELRDSLAKEAVERLERLFPTLPEDQRLASTLIYSAMQGIVGGAMLRMTQELVDPVKVHIEKPLEPGTCTICRGTGNSHLFDRLGGVQGNGPCTVCSGTGRQTLPANAVVTIRRDSTELCKTCNGQGCCDINENDDVCTDCNGRGYVKTDKGRYPD